MLKKLCHCAKSALLEALNINSVSCILESDVELYKRVIAVNGLKWRYL